MTMRHSTSSAQGANRPSGSAGTSAAVLEFICLFTHDLRRKQKRWQDGRLKYHTFNKRVMVYDERGNFVGDMHWREDYDFEEGEEVQLERGGILVQVSECIGQKTQDLSELLDKRAQGREGRHVRATSRQRRTMPPHTFPAVTRIESSSDPSRIPRQRLHGFVNAPPSHLGRAAISADSPFEQRQRSNGNPGRMGEQGPRKRKCDDISPPSKMGYAQSLFGTPLSLSAAPTSSALLGQHTSGVRLGGEVSTRTVALYQDNASSSPFQGTRAISRPVDKPLISTQSSLVEAGEIPRPQVMEISPGSSDNLPSPFQVNSLEHADGGNNNSNQHRYPVLSTDTARNSVQEEQTIDPLGMPVIMHSHLKRKLLSGYHPLIETPRDPNTPSVTHPHTLDVFGGGANCVSAPAAEFAMQPECLMPLQQREVRGAIMAPKATIPSGSDRIPEDGPRTLLRIKPRQKKGLRIMSIKSTLVKEDQGFHDHPYSPPIANNRELLLNDLDSNFEERTPFLSSLPPRTREGRGPSGSAVLKVIGPRERSVVQLVAQEDSTQNHDGAALSPAFINVTELLTIPSKGFQNTTSTYDIPVGRIARQEALAHSSDESTQRQTPQEGRKDNINTTGTEILANSHQPFSVEADSSKTRKRRRKIKFVAASDKDDEQNRACTLKDFGGPKTDPSQCALANELPRVPDGPRLASLGRRGIKSREVIGFVSSSSPSHPTSYDDFKMIDESLLSSNRREQEFQSGGHACPTPANSHDHNKAYKDILSGIHSQESPELNIRQNTVVLLAERGSSGLGNTGQTAILSSPLGVAEAKCQVTQARSDRRQDYNVERYQGLANDENSALPASSASWNLTSVDTHQPQEQMPSHSGSGKTQTRRTASPPVHQMAFRSSKAPTPLMESRLSGTMPESIGQLASSLSDEFGNKKSILPALPLAPCTTSRLANPATRGRKAALKSDAAGQAPQSFLPPETFPVRPSGRTYESSNKRDPSKRGMRFPGFIPAGTTGPWSREAHDLLEIGRPE